MKACPNNPNHTEFRVRAHEYHEWVVGPHGEFIYDSECYDSEMFETTDWICNECGAKALDCDEETTPEGIRKLGNHHEVPRCNLL